MHETTDTVTLIVDTPPARLLSPEHHQNYAIEAPTQVEAYQRLAQLVTDLGEDSLVLAITPGYEVDYPENLYTLVITVSL